MTPLELDIMKAVWRQSPITVREVQFAIRPARKLAYTTVMTIMDRMFHKGLLSRTLKSRAHLYEPDIRYVDARDAAVNGLVDDFFEGSKERLQAFLEGDANTTEPAVEVEVEVAMPAHPSSSLDESLL
jgi:predicted transcriptional regulator